MKQLETPTDKNGLQISRIHQETGAFSARLKQKSSLPQNILSTIYRILKHIR